MVRYNETNTELTCIQIRLSKLASEFASCGVFINQDSHKIPSSE